MSDRSIVAEAANHHHHLPHRTVERKSFAKDGSAIQ